MVTNIAQDKLIRISLPSSTNLQDITVFITKRTVFSNSKYITTTSEFGSFLKAMLCYTPSPACLKGTMVRGEIRGYLKLKL